MDTKTARDSAVTYKMIAEALFDNYESIYDIHVPSKKYLTYYQSDAYMELKLAKSGENFFADLEGGIRRIIALEDQEYVLRMLQEKTLLDGVTREKYYSLIYRIQSAETSTYHQLRATCLDTVDGKHVLMGVRNVDELIRLQQKHDEDIDAMKQREHNHMEAILASAAAYLEANLSQDLVLEKSAPRRYDHADGLMELPSTHEMPSYEQMQDWIAEHLVAKNMERYRRISSRAYLKDCYDRGERRASISFSIFTKQNTLQPCRAVFYLYEERTSLDLHVFSVIYDLTEQQKKEQELEKLEMELEMSQIRNSNSQMKPHFLYNVLGSIQEIILMDPKYASDLLGDFTVHLRSCVRAVSNDEPIPFEEELRNIKAYVNIEKMRFGDKLNVHYEIGEDRFDVLPLSIQPLVENAIRHGIYQKGRAGGSVYLRTFDTQDAWVVQVEDNGAGFDVEKVLKEAAEGKRDSAGIQNLQFRLERVMGGSIRIESVIGKGTTVTVQLPKEDMHARNHCRR